LFLRNTDIANALKEYVIISAQFKGLVNNQLQYEANNDQAILNRLGQTP
jgi:hypothetical protein